MQTNENNTQTVGSDVIAAMLAAQDAAAREFWAYPDAEWQMAFQAQWLVSHGLPATVAHGGLTWGADDDISAKRRTS